MIRWSEYAVAPIFTHIDVSYNELKLTFSQDLKNSLSYSINDFVVNYNDSPVTLKDVYVSNKKLIIHLPESIATKHPSPSIEDQVTTLTVSDLVMENTYSKTVKNILDIIKEMCSMDLVNTLIIMVKYLKANTKTM